MPTRVLVPSGVLGLGFDADALSAGLDAKPDIIAIDGGSTDSGPFYLGAGVSKYSRTATLSEWRRLMAARADAGVPLVLTTAGTCGTDSTVDWMLEITREAAADLGQTLQVATLKSSQAPDTVADALDKGTLTALPDAKPVTKSEILACANVVALAGVEQITEALRTGAEIVVAGRATDTSGIAALPIMRDENIAAAWHGAKIAECGALCSTKPLSGVILVEFDKNGFEVEPLSATARCTPHSVSAHMLYENSNPFLLSEPGGRLDVTHARYEPVSDRRVRVSGSNWRTSRRYTVKLEGASLAGYQTTVLVLLRNSRYTAHAEEWARSLVKFLSEIIPAKTKFGTDDFQIDTRLIGANAALGELENRRGDPVEIGVLGIFTAESQDAANEIARLANPYFLHFPLSSSEELPTFAFPYSPAETPRGPLYEFKLNHTLTLNDPMDAFKLEIHDI